jgi:hypothetical protein
MSTSALELNRAAHRDRVMTQMLEDLDGRFPSVEVTCGPRGWSCVLSGPTWESRFRGPTRYEAIETAHSTYYWSQPQL